MLFARMMALLISTLPLATPALASTSEIALSNASIPHATLRFSCDDQDRGIFVDLDNPPMPFVEEEEVVGIFDVGTQHAFALNGFSVSTGEQHTRLVLDPRYRTAVEDALGVLKGAGNHTFTIAAPKASLMISWPSGDEAIVTASTRYRSVCK